MTTKTRTRLFWLVMIVFPALSLISHYHQYKTMMRFERVVARLSYSDRFIARDKKGNAVVITPRQLVFKHPKLETLRLHVQPYKNKKGRIVGIYLKSN